MRKVLNILLCVTVAISVVCCHGRNGYDRDFLESDTISLTVNREKVFEYDPFTCQLGYNDARKEFRVSTDKLTFTDTGNACYDHRGIVFNQGM